MAIYAWPGIKVQMTEATIAPIWIEHRSGEIKRHFVEPKVTKRTKKIEPTVSWFAKMKADDDGRMLYGGKWEEVYRLKADDGWQEINKAFVALLPPGMAEKFEAWNRGEGSSPTDLFALMPAKEAA